MFRQNIGGDKHAIFKPALGDNALALPEQAWQCIGIPDFDFSAAVSDGENGVESVNGNAPFLDKSTKPNGFFQCRPFDLGRGNRKKLCCPAVHQAPASTRRRAGTIAAMEKPLLCFGVMGAELLFGGHRIGGPKAPTWQDRQPL